VAILPAPLYFLSNGQIQRLETDGTTLTQLTLESAPITAFDVSPIDARLVYITNNQLIEANPQYGSRLVKAEGQPGPVEDPRWRAVERISAPYFSPDGREIAFGLNGVQVIAAGESMTVTTLLTSDPYPAPNTPVRDTVRFFEAGPWSPDGSQILAPFSYWPEAGGLAVMNRDPATLIELLADVPNVPNCCDWAWSRSTGQGFIASDHFVYGIPGLSAADVGSGELTLLVPGSPGQIERNRTDLWRFFRAVHQDSRGNLFVFVSEQEAVDSMPAYGMVQVQADASLREIRAQRHPTQGDILWARDGSGAALVQATWEENRGLEGPIFWLPANGEPVVPLPAQGTHLRWGPSASQPSRESATESLPQDEPATGEAEAEALPQLTAQVLLNVRSGPSTAYPIVGELDEGEASLITGISPDGEWWQIVYPPDSGERAWVTGNPEFSQVVNTQDLSVVTPPPAPRSVGRLFYSAPGPEGRTAIFAQSLAPGAAPELLLLNASQPNLLGGSQQLLVRSERSDLLGLGIYDLSTRQLNPITSHLEDAVASWSPDGQQIVFASTRHGDRRWRIYTMPSSGTVTAAERAFGNDPDWHPVTDRIVYKGCDRVGENCGLWIMDSSGSNPIQLTADRTDSRPVWSPEGRSVVFMSEERDGNWEIYTVNLATAGITRLTDSPALDGLPTVSPDGSRVAFVSNREGRWGVWVVPINGGVPQQVVDLGADLPNWLEQGIHWGE
jgi:Tol biopolymer transport system component